MVPLNTKFHVIRSTYNFFVFLSISGNSKKFGIILHIIIYPIANGHVVWFHYPKFYGGATKYITLLGKIVKECQHFKVFLKKCRIFRQLWNISFDCKYWPTCHGTTLKVIRMIKRKLGQCNACRNQPYDNSHSVMAKIQSFQKRTLIIRYCFKKIF